MWTKQWSLTTPLFSCVRLDSCVHGLAQFGPFWKAPLTSDSGEPSPTPPQLHTYNNNIYFTMCYQARTNHLWVVVKRCFFSVSIQERKTTTTWRYQGFDCYLLCEQDKTNKIWRGDDFQAHSPTFITVTSWSFICWSLHLDFDHFLCSASPSSSLSLWSLSTYLPHVILYVFAGNAI